MPAAIIVEKAASISPRTGRGHKFAAAIDVPRPNIAALRSTMVASDATSRALFGQYPRRADGRGKHEAKQEQGHYLEAAAVAVASRPGHPPAVDVGRDDLNGYQEGNAAQLDGGGKCKRGRTPDHRGRGDDLCHLMNARAGPDGRSARRTNPLRLPRQGGP